MGTSGSFLVGVLLVVSMLHSVSDARRDPSRLRSRRMNFVPAFPLSELAESACFTPDLSDDMYVAVPKALFRKGRECNKTLVVSCAEPYRDLGGPWQVCKSEEIFTLRVIGQVSYNPMEDDEFHLSQKLSGAWHYLM